VLAVEGRLFQLERNRRREIRSSDQSGHYQWGTPVFRGLFWWQGEIAAAFVNDLKSETYQLDYIDQVHVGWSWTMLDTVRIKGTVPSE